MTQNQGGVVTSAETCANCTVLVTGGASGLGRAIALRLASEGADIALLDRNLGGMEETSALLQPTGVQVSLHVADVADDRSVHDGFAAAVDVHGQVGRLVNAAGTGDMARLLDMTVDDWDRCLSINLKGTFLMCQVFIRHVLDRQSGGSIVNIGSMASRMGGEPLLHYGAAKAGVVEFGHGLARDYAADGVRVNAVLPGPVWTPMQKRAMQQLRADKTSREQLGITDDMTDEDAFRRIVARVPLGVAPTPEDVAALVAFLLSDHARSITGQAIAVDGGITMGW